MDYESRQWCILNTFHGQNEEQNQSDSFIVIQFVNAENLFSIFVWGELIVRTKSGARFI